MEKVIYLEADEEITSVIDRIRDIKEDKVALVLPKRANLIQSIVNLKLLKNQIERLNKEVVIVTTDKLGRNLASQVGFIVYQRLNEKPVEVEPKPITQKPIGTKITYRESSEVPKREPQFKIGPSITDITYRKEEIKEPPIPQIPQKEEIIPEKEEPVHKTPELIREKPKSNIIQPAKKYKRLLASNKKLILIVGIVVVLLMALVMFIILPKASVTLLLKSVITEKSFNASVSKDAQSPNFEQGILPGQEVSGGKEETGKNLVCTGKKNLGQKATGTVTLSNSFDENPQSLVTSTRLVSTANGKTYRLTDGVTIPGAKVSGGNIVTGTVTATIEAPEPGDQYNIGNSHFTIPGLEGSAKYEKIYADTSSPIKGGFTEEVTVLSQTDIDTNKEQIVIDLTKKINQELNIKYKDKEVFTDGIKPQMVELSPSIPVDTESAKFDLKVKIKIVTMIVSKNDYDYLIFKKLTAALPSDKGLVQGNLKDLSNKVVSFDEKTGKMAIQIKATGYVITKVDQDKIKQAIAGKSQQETSQYLASLKDVSEAKVSLWPFWVRSVPKLFSRSIKINIDVQK